MAEVDIEDGVVKWARKNGFIVLKLNNPWSKGWPDRLFISPAGTHVYIEFKIPGKEPTPLQRKRARDLEGNNCDVRWYDNKDDAIHWLKETLEHDATLET